MLGMLTSGKVPLEKTLMKKAGVSKWYAARGWYVMVRVEKDLVT